MESVNIVLVPCSRNSLASFREEAALLPHGVESQLIRLLISVLEPWNRILGERCNFYTAALRGILKPCDILLHIVSICQVSHALKRNAVAMCTQTPRPEPISAIGMPSR